MKKVTRIDRRPAGTQLLLSAGLLRELCGYFQPVDDYGLYRCDRWLAQRSDRETGGGINAIFDFFL